MKKKIRFYTIVFIYILSFFIVLFIVQNYSKTKEDYLLPLYELDFNDETYSSYIKSGFGAIEEGRWSNEDRSTIFIPLSSGKAYEVLISVKAFPVESGEQVMEVLVNNQLVGEARISNFENYETYILQVPPEYIGESNYITFQYNSLKSLVNEENMDKKSVNFNYIRFREIKDDN